MKWWPVPSLFSSSSSTFVSASETRRHRKVREKEEKRKGGEKRPDSSLRHLSSLYLFSVSFISLLYVIPHAVAKEKDDMVKRKRDAFPFPVPCLMAVPSWSTRQWVEKGREKTCQSDQREREVSERSFFSLISHTLTAHTPSLLTVPAVSSARHHFLAHDRLRDSEAKGALARRGKRRERADRSPLSYLPRPERNGMGGRGPNSFSLPCLLTAIPHSTLHLHAIASGSEGLARDGKSEGDGCVVSPYPSLWLTYRHTPIHSFLLGLSYSSLAYHFQARRKRPNKRKR